MVEMNGNTDRTHFAPGFGSSDTRTRRSGTKRGEGIFKDFKKIIGNMDESDIPDIKAIFERLKEAVSVTLNPSVIQEQRLMAYTYIEKVQENPTIAVQVGFHLCGVTNDSAARHLGLQLVENAIKYNWLRLNKELKAFIKDSTVNLITRGTRGILSEEIYIKDKISRLFVEMIKREWPQQWPSLLDELNELASEGPTQTELVLLIFVRLSEDIATLKTLENSSRCNDIHHALCNNLFAIFNFFFGLLEEHYCKYTNCNVDAQLVEHCKIIQALLITISSYVEWVGFQYFKSHLGPLCTAICSLFSDENLRIFAAECLLQLSNRKLDSKDSFFISILFTPTILSSLYNIAVNRTDNYHLQKILNQVTMNLGNQLMFKMSKEHNYDLPSEMKLYLRALLAFTQHPSFVISNGTFPLWITLFKRDIFNIDPLLQESIPRLIEICFQKLLRHGFPSAGDEASMYSKLDFSSDQDYSTLFYNQRADIWVALRYAAISAPEHFYSYFHKCLLECLSIPPTPVPTCEKEICTPSSPSAAAWDRIGVILEGVIAKVPELQTFQPMLQKNIELINACLKYECNDPVILTALLNCLSGFSVFVDYAPEILPFYLERLFSACAFSIPGHPKGNRPKKVKNVRKHSASLVVKLASLYPHHMLVYFDNIDLKVSELSRDRTELTILEKSTLDQARLILISYLKDGDKQNACLSKVLHQAIEDWNSVKDGICSSLSLMETIGLTKEPPLDINEDPCVKNRSALHYSLVTFNAVIRRSIIPDEIRKSVYDDDPNASSPALAHMLPLIPSLCHLVRSHNGLWTDEALAALCPTFAKAYWISLPQRMEICCLHSKYNMNLNAELNVQENSPVYKMQGFTYQMTEALYISLGSMCKLGSEFYKLPQLTEYLIHSALYNLNNISDFRMRVVIRAFLRPFIFSCPEELHDSIVLPLLHHFCPIMKDHLSNRWSSVREQIEMGNYDPDSTDLDEMFEDATLRLLTRDYIDLIRELYRTDCCGSSAFQPAMQNGEDHAADGPEEDMDVDAGKLTALGDQDERFKMASLGRAILLCDPICHSLVSTLLKAFSWMDSTACKRTLMPLLLMLRGMMQDTPQHLNENAIVQIYTSIISGLHFHGQHADMLTQISDFACTVYELFRPHFPGIRQVLLQLPNASEADINELDRHVLKTQAENANDKKLTRLKKSRFKNVINGIIGKSLSEAFKKDVEIQDLAPMFRIPRPKQVQLDEVSSDFNLSSLFKELPQTHA